MTGDNLPYVNGCYCSKSFYPCKPCFYGTDDYEEIEREERQRYLDSLSEPERNKELWLEWARQRDL